MLIPSFVAAASLVLDDPTYDPTPPIGLQTLKATISALTSLVSLPNRYPSLQFLPAGSSSSSSDGSGVGGGRSLQTVLGALCMSQLQQANAMHAMGVSNTNKLTSQASTVNMVSAAGPVVRFAHESVQSMCVHSVYVLVVDELVCEDKDGPFVENMAAFVSEAKIPGAVPALTGLVKPYAGECMAPFLS